jgi:hypothetical protein
MTDKRHSFARNALAVLAILAVPAAAVAQSSTDRPVTDHHVSAEDVANTPLSDLNVKKRGIPPVLIAAEHHPYSLDGLATCPALAGAIGTLNRVLGDDIDVQVAKGEKVTAGGVAQSVVQSIIPFSGVIREVSGANAEQRKLQAAIYAGVARRSFLKGVGLQRNCPYPARPAPALGRVRRR